MTRTASVSVCPPRNLHISVSCPTSPNGGLRERVEQKFFVTPGRVGMALALLRRTCRPDPIYPRGRVNSLYFDTVDLDQHQRSLSGELLKDKVRIRWYGEDHDPHRSHANGIEDTVRVWLELKSRRGFAATKQRLSLLVDSSVLVSDALPRGIVPLGVLAATMAEFGFYAPFRLRPVVTISYHRYRFVEPRSGFRISIDSRIRSSLVIPDVGCGERGLELPGAVVEVKGPLFELPSALRPIADIGSTWTRYSKCSSSLDAHAADRGSVSRSWPSGMMEPAPGALARVNRKPQRERS